jgi:hypothetical protein
MFVCSRSCICALALSLSGKTQMFRVVEHLDHEVLMAMMIWL